MFTSSRVKGEYGLRARLPIPAKTMVGFYEGTVVDSNHVTPYNDYVMTTYGGKCIDASEFLSGFGRYMNCAIEPQDQNVSFEKVESRRANKRVIMVTTVNIAQGSELYTQYGLEYWEEKMERLPEHDTKNRRCCLDMMKTARKSNTMASRYHSNLIKPVEAQMLKEQFEGGVASEDEDDAGDSDFTDSA